ncbi:hypothetical protein BH18ACI4_BH18ACI4_01400 [soil metagenome]
MLKDMAEIAAECVKHPIRKSVWSPKKMEYVCPQTEELGQYLSENKAQFAREGASAAKPPINAHFKLVFLTAAGGTILFTLICVTLYLVTHGKPPEALDKFISGLFDLAKIGFGAIVGLLGAQKLQSESR